MKPSQLQTHFDDFYAYFFDKLCPYGVVAEVVVCDNISPRRLTPLRAVARQIANYVSQI